MTQISSADYESMSKYLNWIAKVLDVESFGDLPVDASDYSYYITRIVNSCMADFCLMELRKKDKNFRMTSFMTPEEQQQLCDLIGLIFQKCCLHPQVKMNFGVFAKRNGYDYYFRFLCYLWKKKYLLTMNRMMLDMIRLLGSSNYSLPSIYRK